MAEFDSPHKVILYPYVTEKTMVKMEEENKLEFIVSLKSNKKQIKDAIKDLFEADVEKVNTRIDQHGKRATVKFTEEHSAEEIGMRIGVF